MAVITTTQEYTRVAGDVMFSDYPEVKGIYIGGCVERGEGSSFRALAHAHTSKSSEYHGWICVRSAKRLYTSGGRPSQIMLHELAHIVTGQGHTDKWRAKAKELGYRIPAHYQKHARRGRGVRRRVVLKHTNGQISTKYLPASK